MNTASPTPTLRLGFARGTAPSKWAKRWAERVPDQPLELIPLTLRGTTPPGAAEPDLRLERCAPGTTPTSSVRHGVHLYTEAVALVVAADHELAEHAMADRDTLALVTLLTHPDHAPEWPTPEPWQDPSWEPAHAAAALELVATGLGAVLLPMPLARHLAVKREHAVIPLAADAEVPGTDVWVTWAIARDGDDIQQLVGIMRGRTAQSARTATPDTQGERSATNSADTPPRAKPAPQAKPLPKKKALPKNSRGAQLAAARAKQASTHKNSRKSR